MTTRLSVIALLFAGWAVVLIGQGRELPQLSDPFPQRPPTPTFRSGIELVQVDVYVTDEDGKPVTGLTADDFEVFEDGQRQVITTFTPVNIPIERSEALPFEAEPDVLMNNRPPGHLYLFVMSGTEPDWALRGRHLARQFINDYFGDNDIAAVITGRTFPGDRQDFTSNRRLLISAVDRFAGEAIDVVELADLMEMFARMPGSRKVVVWFGGAPPLVDPFDLDRRPLLYTRVDDARHAALAAAMRGNIRWYQIDPQGLTPSGGLDKPPAETAPPIGGGGGNPYSVFDMTGGFALVNSNNFTNAFERLVAETSTYYLLGFESSHRRAEGRYVELEVKVKRPGLKVRARTGYLEEFRYKSRPPYVEPQRTPVEAALANPLATSGMGMRVTAAPFKSSGRDATVTLAVDLDASELTFNDKNGSFAGTLELRHLATDVDHKIYPEFRHTSTMTLDAANLKRLRASGVRIVSQFDVPKGRYQVRVAATSGGWNGSVVYDVEVPDFTADPLALSGVALAALTPAATATLRPSAIKRTSQKSRQCRAASCEASVVMESRLTAWSADVEKTGDAHMLRDVLPAPPTTTREFAPEETLALYAEVYDNNRAADRDAPYAIRLTASLLDASGAIMREVSDERSSRAPRRPSGGHGFTLHVPLAGAAAGPHLLQFEARSDRNPSQIVTRRIPIRLLSR